MTKELNQRKPTKHSTLFTRSNPSQKRWSLACKSVYFVSSLSQKILPKNKQLIKGISRTPSYLVLDIDNGATIDGDFAVEQGTLTTMTREKNLESLTRLGGVKNLALTLGSNNVLGVSSKNTDLVTRKNFFGSNVFEKPPKRMFFSFVLEAFQDTTIIILLLCATMSLGFGIKQHGIKAGWYDGGSIIIAVILVIAVSAISNFKQNRQFVKLSDESSDIKIEVLRDGHRQQVSIFDIVVGEIVFLKIGDQISADGMFLDGHSLKVDESSMTGESDHVIVNDSNPFLFSGTKVTDGYGRMLVTSVGMNTTYGEMMSSITQESDEQTPLQTRLDKLTSCIGKVGLLVALLVLVVLFIRYFTGHTTDEYGHREFILGKTKTNDVINAIIKIVSIAVTIVVVAIPEGLPLAVTLTLAYSMRKMMADNAMVRKLSACETMGSATIICTDKTGTLTLNQMNVTEFWQGNELVQSTQSLESNVQGLLQQAIGLNTTGSISRLPSESVPKISGSPTEKAILKWGVSDMGMDMDELTQRFELVKVETFNSEKKKSGVIIRERIGKTTQVHWKGAAEMILEMSTYYNQEGIIKSIDDLEMKHFLEIIQSMAAKSLRCIAFAYKELEDDHTLSHLDESGLTLLGIVGLKDPCRPGVQEAVKSCCKAGVAVKMITGDNIFTATAIGIESGILKPEDEFSDGAVVEGIVFRNYTLEERMQKIDKIKIMARSSPFDKLLMVQCLKMKGHVVAVTGDGTNDAPALKEADIGLAMGIQGTEVAKESSDIVILDDNFSSVVTVLRWGRCVYNNIQKFIQFQLTVNIAALLINFIAATSSGNVPLTAVQMLWVNLIMDTLGALALATETPTDDLMKKSPVGRSEPLITKPMWRNLIGQAMYQMTVLLILQFKGRDLFNTSEKVKDTLIFNCFVLCQVFNEFNARQIEKKNIFTGVLKNRLFLGIVGITIALQVVMVEILKKFAGTERLTWGQWGVCIAIASLTWPIGWLVKCIPVSITQRLSDVLMRNTQKR